MISLRRGKALADVSDEQLLAELRRRIKTERDRERIQVRRGVLDLYKTKMATNPEAVLYREPEQV